MTILKQTDSVSQTWSGGCVSRSQQNCQDWRPRRNTRWSPFVHVWIMHCVTLSYKMRKEMTSFCLYNQHDRHHDYSGGHSTCFTWQFCSRWMFERPSLLLALVSGIKQGNGAGQHCSQCISAKQQYAFRVHLLLITRHTGKRQPSTSVLKSLTFYPNCNALVQPPAEF